MNSNLPKENKLREVLVSHFDDEALKKSSNDDLKIYGSRDNNEYLRAPYEFVEKELLNNISGLRVLDYISNINPSEIQVFVDFSKDWILTFWLIRFLVVGCH